MENISAIRNSKMELGEVYFWTSSIYQWKHLLKPDKYKQLIINSLINLFLRGKIKVYGFVIMHNHLHLLWEMLEMNRKEMPHASFQKFTAHAIQKELLSEHPEVLTHFKVNEKERQYRYWQRDALAVKVFSAEMAEQKFEYMHSNPLQSHWNLVLRPEDYIIRLLVSMRKIALTLNFLPILWIGFKCNQWVVCEDTGQRGCLRLKSKVTKLVVPLALRKPVVQIP